MRAVEPQTSGFAVREGVNIAFDVYGEGERTLLFMPAWSIVHSRMWKGQVPYFARHARVVTFDGRGNGRSDKTPDLDYSDDAFVADALAVLDATATHRATVIGLSAGGRWGLMLAARAPERVEQLICIGPAVPLGTPNAGRAVALARFNDTLASHEGWNSFNRHFWREHYPAFLDFFFHEAIPEAHSTKQLEDCVSYGLATDPQTLAATAVAPQLTPDDAEGLAKKVRCPVLVLHGEIDRIVPPARGRALAEATGGRYIELPGSGHIPNARIPARINALLREAIEPTPSAPRVRSSRRKRALFISSPIGLGHAQRDAAIAAELRGAHSDVEVHWLAQHPVTEVLRARNEFVHPASTALANETRHIESECGEHDLHAFQAIRRMDEILVNNYMVLHDLLREEHYDLVVGDEAWDVDHFLHEHPDQKQTAFVWMTDFVGWIPMPDGGAAEIALTSDYNSEMLEHIARHPGLRDRSLFVGTPEDIVPLRFGPDLPPIRDWVEAHYDFPGYITGFSPPSDAERAALRAAAGYGVDEPVCIVTVGGSGVGTALLRKIMSAYPQMKRALRDLRMVVVAGPRIDPASLPRHDGLEVHAFVPDLHRQLAACDIAIVQGGLTTTMELVAARRPFIYFPLQHHFEQHFHVRHRLDRHRAGRCMTYAQATPEELTQALVEELARKPDYLPVASDGAANAAALIAEVL